MERDYKLKVNKFIIGLSIFYFLIFIKTYDAEMTIYNTSLLAFSYKYGFIPRAFIGSIYNLLDVILPVDMYTYAMAMRFIEIVTALFFAIMILIARKTLLMIDRKYFEPVGVLWIIYGVLFVSMFSTKYNFGRVDLPTGDRMDMKKSILKLSKLEIVQLFPGHGPYAITNVDEQVSLSLMLASRF